MKDLCTMTDTIWNGDCIDFLRKMPDKYVDLVLTDPPYGIGNKFTSNFGLAIIKNERGTFDWNDKIPDDEVFNEIFRVSKNQIIFGGNYYKCLPTTNAWIVWDKKGDYDLCNPFSDCELAWTSFKHPIRKFTCIQQGFIKSDKKTKRIHPTQKPLPLFRTIIEKYTKPNDIVLDPFSGSGTTACACYELKRRFICIEKDFEYYNASCERLKEFSRQGFLEL